MNLTTGKVHDAALAQTTIEKLRAANITVVMDRGYNDYSLFAWLSKRGTTFVTRLKDNAVTTPLKKGCRSEGDTAVIGITDFAQSQLGDIVFVDVPTVGETLAAGEVFGSIEAVKTVSDAFLPVGGEILEFNEAVDADPAVVNKDAYGEGWLVKVRMTDPAEYDALLDAAAYEQLIG